MPSERIRDQLNPLVIARGDVYAAGGRVTLIGADPDFVGAIVRGSVPYDVTLRYELRGGTVPTLVMSCMCAAAPRGPCKHVWAALRVAERSGHLANASRAPGHLAIGLAGPDPPYGGGPEVRWVIDLTSSRGHSAVPIDVYERAASGLGFSTGFRKVTLRRRSFDPRLVPGGTLADLVALARTGRCDVRSAHDEPASALVVDEGAPFAVVLTVDGAGTIDGGMPALAVRGSLRREGEELSLGALSGIYDSGVAFLGPRAVRIECDVPLRWVDAIREQGELLVPAEESVPFLRELLRRCRRSSFVLDGCIAIDERPSFVARVQVHRPDATVRSPLRKLLADVAFDYGGTKAPWNDRGRFAFEPARQRVVVRDLDGEQRAIAELFAAGFDRASGEDSARRALKIAPARLTAAILALPAERFIVEADGVVHRRAARTSLSVRSGVDWFDLTAAIDFGGITSSMPALLEAARRGDRLVRLGDGTVGILPERWLARLVRVMELSAREQSHELRFRRSQLMLVDALLADENGAHGDSSWEGPLASLRTQLLAGVAPAEREPPLGFRGELRDYQRQGLAWMQWLAETGFSGCLADDMGLGKTIQVLALLADRRARGLGSGPSLVVAPRSVIYNWVDEATRFAPQLVVVELSGDAREEELRRADLIVTTYGILRRRVADLTSTLLDYVILDEANAIKNAGGATAQAACALRSRHRLALTGTPVENHLGELTALFDFLNPGMLGRRVHAMARAGLELDPETAARLGRGLRPFVLRRKKADVLTELPPRIDQVLTCTMESAQRAVYDRVKTHYQAKLLGAGRDGPLRGPPLAVLEALLRLRQIACHPGLADPALRQERSAKLDVLLERLEPLVAQGKKAVVFSQFTTLLDLVGRDLAARGVCFTRLDGKTSDRKAVVERFQTDPACCVFLVSLKAGGVGLNLTAAEYVFLLDPWWNPAAEAQAVDRAHRMGQKATVVAYRLLCKDSIDERVAELQDRKGALATSVFGETEGMRLGSLSVGDVEALLS